MTSFRICRFIAAFSFGVAISTSFCRAEIILGDPPTAPTDVSGLPGGGPRAQGGTGGFSVNTDSREEVRSFYNAVYRASDGVPMNTTADVATCTPGTNGTVYKEAVLRRINWFRAMAGLPAEISFDAGNNAKCQRAAVMMSANNTLSHTPPPSWICYTADGADAADSSNIALGSSGADSITSYMKDSQANNTAVGHRRWLIYPQTEIMGTGDVPRAGSLNAANSTWVFDANFGGPRPATRTPYTAWPPAGYVPRQVVFPRWSFGLPGANLSGASVTMRSNGVPVSVAYEPYTTGYGENTRVWVPMGLNANNDATVFPFYGADTVYSIAISNIAGAAQSFYVYTVTVFDPAVPGPDYAPPVISGSSQPGVGQSNVYTFTGLSYASRYDWRATRATNFNFFDGAETSLANFTTSTSPGYAVRDSAVKATGSFSFHLAHPDPPVDQMLTLNQVFVPKTNGTLTVKSRLGYAGDAQTARVQLTTDGGVGWQDIYSQVGSGGQGETTFATRSFPLAAFAGSMVQLRFSYDMGSGSYFNQTSSGVGWYLDDIVVTNAEVWTVIATNSTTTTTFAFNPPQPTSYNLNVRGIMYDEFPLDWGPTLTVVATTNVPAVIAMSQPVVAGGQVQLPFMLTAGSPPTFKLLQADQPTGPWTTNVSATLTTNVPGSSYRFTTTVGPAQRFYRVKTP